MRESLKEVSGELSEYEDNKIERIVNIIEREFRIKKSMRIRAIHIIFYKLVRWKAMVYVRPVYIINKSQLQTRRHKRNGNTQTYSGNT